MPSTTVGGSTRPAAATLGATASQAFRRVTLPPSMPGVAVAGLLVFINSESQGEAESLDPPRIGPWLDGPKDSRARRRCCR